MSLTNLGKKVHRAIRSNGSGEYVDGEYIKTPDEEITIYANIQPAMASYRTQLLPEGDRNKEAISIYSNDWLYTTRGGVDNPLNNDIIIYRGAMWEIVVSRPYGNFGEHCEALAIKLNESEIPRITGTIQNVT